MRRRPSPERRGTCRGRRPAGAALRRRPGVTARAFSSSGSARPTTKNEVSFRQSQTSPEAPMRRSSRSLPILDLLAGARGGGGGGGGRPGGPGRGAHAERRPSEPGVRRLPAQRRRDSGAARHLRSLVPAPVNSRSWAKAPLALGPLALATSYDLRDTGKLSPVRDQGDYNTCWSFASLASLESYLLPVHRRGLQRRQPRHGRRWRLRLRLQRRRQLPDGDRRAHPLERSGRRDVRPL